MEYDGIMVKIESFKGELLNYHIHLLECPAVAGGGTSMKIASSIAIFAFCSKNPSAID